ISGCGSAYDIAAGAAGLAGPDGVAATRASGRASMAMSGAALRRMVPPPEGRAGFVVTRLTLVARTRSLPVGGPLEHPILRAGGRLRPVGEMLAAAPRLGVAMDVATPRIPILGKESLQVIVVAPVVGTPSVCHASLLVAAIAGALQIRKGRAHEGRARQVSRCYKDRES